MAKETVLQNGIDLGKLQTTGVIIEINEELTNLALNEEEETQSSADQLGKPVKSIKALEKQMVSVDDDGLVKKKILEEGGGLGVNMGCTVSIAYTGYFENEHEAFDIKNPRVPMVVDLADNGLLPGLQIAVESMLVGELSVFVLSYKLMYGDMGVPPRIKPMADCVFYIKLIKSINTPKEGRINFNEENMFKRVHREVNLLHASGVELFKKGNNKAAITHFKTAVNMLFKCRLANEEEEAIQEKLLISLFTNLAICYNKTRDPLKACIACNEINRIKNIWNNGKVLFQNAKALRMIGDFKNAEKRLNKALVLCPNSVEMKGELALLKSTKDSFNKSKLMVGSMAGRELIDEEFKNEVNSLVKNFKVNPNLCKLTLPSGLGPAEIDYVKEVCRKENVYFAKLKKDFALDKEETSSELIEKFNETPS